MQAIINVELDGNSNLMGGIDDRYAMVLSSVRKFFARSVGEIRVAEHEGSDGIKKEWTAVVTFEFHAQKNVVLQAVTNIARNFDQDCVAILFSDGEGRLVGPEADRSGGFKLQQFKRPAFYELLKEAV